MGIGVADRGPGKKMLRRRTEKGRFRHGPETPKKEEKVTPVTYLEMKNVTAKVG